MDGEIRPLANPWPVNPHPVLKTLIDLLVAIPHYFNTTGSGRYGSSRSPAPLRAAALRNAVTALHKAFPARSAVLNIQRRVAVAGPASVRLTIKVVTAGAHHILDGLDLPAGMIQHVELGPERPVMLGLACHRLLAQDLTRHTHFAFLEDDLIVHDTDLLHKLSWFTARFGPRALLQPNRYEWRPEGEVRRLYIDGPLRPDLTERYRGSKLPDALQAEYGGRRLRFRKALNPHSGCFFLTRTQMKIWTSEPHFLDEDVSFIGPLESNATLGLMKTFTVYKTTEADSDFVQIEHTGDAFLSLLGTGVAVER